VSERIRIYTDGGCRPNPGPGGWAAVILVPGAKPRELSGGERETTNNRMELTAAMEGLGALAEPSDVEIVTDSQYLRQGITQWISGWRRRGWRTAGGDDVRNRDLWERLDEALDRHTVIWRWVKGHAGDRWNERADRLASAAIPRPPLPVDDPGAVHLFVAVARSAKRGRSAWAAVMRYRDHEDFAGEAGGDESANRTHLRSVIGGLERLTRRVRVHVYTTSDYLKDGASGWIGRWRRTGWQTREGKPVANRDLWQRLDRAMERHDVRWHVVDRDDPPPEIEEAKRRARELLATEE
jgi:ribonuclease HI